MPVCRRELFEELSRLLGELDSALIGEKGFIPFVRSEFYTFGNKSARIRAALSTTTTNIARLRELAGLLASEVETPTVEVVPVVEPPALPAGEITTEELVARLETPPAETPPVVVVPDESADDGWFDLENPPVVVHPPGTDLRTPLEPLPPDPVETRAPPGFVWVGLQGQRVLLPLFDDGPPVPPRRPRPDLWEPPPAPPPAPPPPAPVEPPPAPPPAPPVEVVPGTPPPAPAVPAPLETGGSVKLLDYAKITRFHEGAWTGLVSALPEDMGKPGAYVATANVVLDASRVPNKRALSKLLDKVEKGRESETKRVKFSQVVALVARVTAAENGDRLLFTAANPGSPHEPMAFEADGTRYLSIADRNGVRAVVKLDYFLLCRGLLTGTPVGWWAMASKLPSAKPGGKGWSGIVGRVWDGDNRAGAVVATITEADMVLTPAQEQSLDVQRRGIGGGDFAKFSRG